MTIYMMVMILNLDTLTQATTVTNEIEVRSIILVLFSSRGDLKKGAAEESAVDLRICSILILLKIINGRVSC